ncbi:MAG: class I SAM-dependent methyltransferase, partial [Gemmatimonadota bacterium]
MPEWFEEWFHDEYLALYPHRDEADAAQLVELLRRQVGWQQGWRVLDVACGPGRHARAIEAAGARCIGLDLSMTLLRRARAVTDAPLIRADMRRIPVRPRSMDLTLNLFTSFGYFEDDA